MRSGLRLSKKRRLRRRPPVTSPRARLDPALASPSPASSPLPSIQGTEPATWIALPMGKAISASALPTAVAEAVRRDLDKARKGLVLHLDLHLLFLITPQVGWRRIPAQRIRSGRISDQVPP